MEEELERRREEIEAEVLRRVEEANLTLVDYENAKKKIIIENADLLRQIEELENNNMTLQKIRATLAAQLDEQRRIADDEAKERQFMLGKFRNLEHEVGDTIFKLASSGTHLLYRLIWLENN